MRQRLQEIAQAVAATQDAAVVDAGTAMVQALLHLIAVLRAQIAEFDRQIAATAAIHPELWLLASLPGASEGMTPPLGAAFGTQREPFYRASAFQTPSRASPVPP